MSKKDLFNLLSLALGVILQILFWNTNVILLGVLAYAILIYGFVSIANTTNSKIRKKNKQNNMVEEENQKTDE